MRKMMATVVSYAVFCLAVCFFVSLKFFERPELLPGDSNKYVLVQTLLLFFRFLPAIVSGGFLVGCAVSFAKTRESAVSRFKNLILSSIVLVFALFAVSEVALPALLGAKSAMESTPVVFSDFMSMGRKCFADGDFTLSVKYARDALSLSPKDEGARALYERALAAKNLEHSLYSEDFPADSADGAKNELSADSGFGGESARIQVPREEFANETISSLLRKSDAAMAEGRLLDAHYYAYLAVVSGNPSEINYIDAKRRASEAWNLISEPASFVVSEDMELFRKKRFAYLLLLSGDDRGAYYRFSELSRISESVARDPDVSKYLKIATERVQNQYFFIDEVEDLKKFESDKNVYFSVPHADGSRDVVSILGITPIRDSGRAVQYLRSFSVYSFDSDGNFVRSVSSPYAKMVSESASSFSDRTLRMFGVEGGAGDVPYILLRGLDSRLPGRGAMPEFGFGPGTDSKANQEFSKTNFLILPISSEDFSLICDCSAGAQKMNLVSLWKFYRKARNFGYSGEIFGATLIQRLSYPFLLLVLFVFLAVVAWNYQLSRRQFFKFKWILIFPVLSAFLYFAFELLQFVMRVLTYASIGFAGNASVFLILGMLALLLIFVSAAFIGKR